MLIVRDIRQFYACKRNREEKCLEGLKCLNKELLAALSNKQFMIVVKLFLSKAPYTFLLKKTFNRVRAISTF